MTPTPRSFALVGVATVALWITGTFIRFSSEVAGDATDAQILAWVQDNTNRILSGGWLFAVGCLGLIWIGAIVRSHLAERGAPTEGSIVFGGALATAIFGIASAAGDLAAAIDKNDISAASAGALHHLNDMFFVGAELSAIALVGGFAVAAWRTGAFPRAWAVFSALLGVVLLIGPIGWVGVIFGIPIWTLGTTALLVRRPRRHAAAQTTATAAT